MATRFLTFNGAARPIPPRCSANPSHRILLVDDDEDIRGIYAETLVQNGYKVEAAGDGQAGWKALQARKYDLLITDHEMPRLTGLELVKKVCQAGLSVPVIIASGSLSPGELKRHPSIHFDAALPKPFSPQELLQTVQHVLCRSEVVGLPRHRVRGS
jgi:two-component system OmpR family response regulator